jgi:hypothetical protein
MGEAGLMGAAALGGVGVGIAFPLPFWDAVMWGGDGSTSIALGAGSASGSLVEAPSLSKSDLMEHSSPKGSFEIGDCKVGFGD